MQAWLLLAHNGQGSAHKVSVLAPPGREVARAEDLTLGAARYNGRPVDADTRDSALCGLRALARTFKDDACFTPQSFSGWHFSTDADAGNVTGQSDQLLLAICTYLAGLARLEGKVRGARTQPCGPFAATGTIDASGRVGRVDHVPAKLDAAIPKLPAGSFLFIPSANVSEVTAKHHEDANAKGSSIVFVTHLIEALQELGVSANGFWKHSPWRALEPYELQHSPIYFGRASEVEEFADLLLQREDAPGPQGQPCPGGLVVGASGTGKSSFVRAGVLPYLRTLPEGRQKPLQYTVWRPRDALAAGATDEAGMAGSIWQSWCTRHNDNASGFAGIEQPAGAEGLQSSGEQKAPTTLAALPARLAAALMPGWRTVWVVDQLEELFTLGFKPEAQIALAALLGQLQQIGVWVIATLRIEYVPEYQKFLDGERRPVLMDVFGGLPYVLPPVSNPGLEDVIKGPAAVAGLSFAPADDKHQPPLDRVIFAAAAKGDSAQLLGYAMHEVWSNACEAAAARGETGPPKELSFDDYRRLGDTKNDGINGVLGRVADEALARLDPSAQAELPRLLEALSTTVTAESYVKETSRPCSLADWKPGTPGGELVQGLKAAGLLQYEGGKAGSETQVRVAHELLFVHWEKARDLLLDLRKKRPFLEYLKTRRGNWELTGKDEDLLTSAVDLEQAATFREQLEHRLDRADLLSYVDLSVRAEAARKEQERQRQRRRRIQMTSVAGALTVMLIGLAVAVFLQQQQSREAALQGEAKSLLEAQQWVQAGNHARGIDTVLASLEARRATEPRPGEEAVLLRSWLMTKPEHTLPRQEGQPNPAIGEISTDGTSLLTASGTSSARVVSLRAGAIPHYLPSTEPLEMAVYLGASTQVLTATSTNLKLWSGTGDEHSSYPKGKDERVVAVAANGRQVLLGSAGAARVLDLVTSREIPLPVKTAIKAGAFDSQGKQVLLSAADGSATLWRLSGTRPQPLQVAAGQDDAIGEQVAFSPDDQWLAAGFDNRSIQVCRVLDTRLQCHRLEVARPDALAAPKPRTRDRRMRVAFSPDSTRLYALIHSPANVPLTPQVSGVQGTTDQDPGESGLGAWMLDGPGEPQLLGMVGLRHQPTHMALSKTGDRIVLAGRSPTVQVLDLTMPVWEVSEIVVFQPDQTLVRMFFNPHSGEVAFLANDGQITSWDPEPRYPRRVLIDPHGERIEAFAFDADGQGLSTHDPAGRVRHWRFSSPAGDPVPGSVPDQNTGPSKRPPSCTEFASAEAAQRQLKHVTNVRCLAESPDRRYFATADALNRIRLWRREDRAASTVPATLPGHTGAITDLTFSPDSRRLLSSSADGTARLWMLDDVAPAPVVLEGHNGAVLRSDFNALGDRVGTLSADGQLRIWETPSGARLVQIARSATTKR